MAKVILIIYHDSILWLPLLLLSIYRYCFLWYCYLLLFLLLVNQKHSHRCVQSFYPTPHSSPHWNLSLQRITQSVKAATCFAAFGFRVTLRCHVTTNAVLSSSGASRIGWNLLPGCWVAKWDEAFQFLWLRFLWLSCGWLPFRRPKPSWRMSKVPWQHPEFWPCTCQSEGKQKNCFGVPKIGRPGEAALNGDLWRSVLKHVLGISPTF